MDARRRLLDDLAKLATSAAGLVQGTGREAEQLMRQRFERLLDRLDLVNRDEFEVVREMAERARTENEALAARIAKLEIALKARKNPAKPRTKPKKPAAKTAKSSTKKS